MDRPLPRRSHAYPHVRLVHLPSSAEHAAGGASARLGCDPDDAVDLQFETEAEDALGLPPGVHSYALLPIGYPMGQSAALLSQMSSMKIGGASLTEIRVSIA